MKELNTLAIKKYEVALGGIPPTMSDVPNALPGDMVIDTDATPRIFWRCSETAGDGVFLLTSYTEKASIGTGLWKGGLLSVNTSSGSITFDIASGRGVVADQTDPASPITNTVVWSAKTNVAATYLTTDSWSNVFLDVNAATHQTNHPVTFQETRDYIFLGRLIHNDMTTINAALSLPRVLYDMAVESDDLSMALGNVNVEGNIYTANGVNLNINKSSGTSYRLGANYVYDVNLPNVTTDSVGTALTFRYRYRDGAGGFATSAATTTIDPNSYDNNSPLGPTAMTGSDNKWTIQRIYYFPSSSVSGPVLGNTYVTYGQAVYTSLADAKAAIGTEAPVVDPYFPIDGSLRCYLVVKKATTALNNTAQNVFIPTGKLGEMVGATPTGGDVIGPTSAVDNSLARFDGTSGKYLKDGANIVVTDNGMIIGGKANVASINTTYNVTTNDNYLFANASGGSFAVNLPTASGITGQYVTIKKVDSTANDVTITPNGSEKIDDQPTKVINTQYSVTTVIADGSNWWIV